MDHLGLVEAVDRFGESVVVGVAHATNRRLDASFGKTLAVSNADVLRTPDALLFVKRQFE